MWTDCTTPWTAAISDGAAVAYEGFVYLVGGWAGSDYVAVNTLTKYNPETQVFASLTAMSVRRGDISAELVYVNNHPFIYVMGGYIDWEESVKTVERYYVHHATSETEADMLFDRGDMASGLLEGSRHAYIAAFGLLISFSPPRTTVFNRRRNQG